MSDTKPKSWQARRATYKRQNGTETLTGPQMRRDEHERAEAKGKAKAAKTPRKSS